MSGLLEALTEPPRRRGIAGILLALTPAESERLAELLADDQVAAPWLSKVLTAHGYPVEASTINKWRARHV